MQLLIITDDLELKLLKKSKRFTVLGPLQWKVPIKLKQFWGALCPQPHECSSSGTLTLLVSHMHMKSSLWFHHVIYAVWK